MRRAAAPWIAPEDYVFRFDTPIPPRLFGDELDLHGWLLRRDGEAIQGIRAVVRSTFHREKVVRARRKRNRPDVEAAFPDLPEAKSCGFLLELRLSLGANRLEFQVQDQAGMWRTFQVAIVRAMPLATLRGAGFPRVRERILASLTRTSSARNKLLIKPAASVASAPLPIIRRVDLFAARRSNLFILEIGELIAAGFRELGCEAALHLDEPPAENPPNDVLQIVVTPHEFFNLYLTEQVSRERARELTRGAVLLCTEQPETGWFQSNLQWAPFARSVADINPLGVLAYCAREACCHHLPLGYHPVLSRLPMKPQTERTIEVTFLGSLTPRREEFFARHADFFSERRCCLRFVPLHFAKTETTRSYLTTGRRNELLADTKILLNVHYSEQRYFEWHRMLVGLANGCCIISETSDGHGPLVPGEHFIMVEPENLIAACEYYLQRPNECAQIARQGSEFVEKHLRQSQMCESFLRELQTSGCELLPDASAKALPAELTRQFTRQARKAFRRAAEEDFRQLFSRAVEESDEPAAIDRTEVIAKRKALGERLGEQEKQRAAGEGVWTLHDNAPYAACGTPALSVVITLFNYARFIGECIRSIERAAAQFGKPLEIVIVDDASTDDSLAQAISHQKQTNVPIRVVAEYFNTGLADARNIGTQLARAPFVFMMDADNLAFPLALRELYEAITTEDAAAAFSILCRFQEAPENRIGLLSPYDWDPQILVQHPYVDAMAMFRRDVLLELGGYDNQLLQIGWFGWEDYDMWLRFASRDLPVAFVPNILCLYRQHERSMIGVTNLFELDLVRHFLARFRELNDRFEPQARLFGVEREKIERRFFIASGCPIATTTLYRCEHLREQLEMLGYTAQVAEWFSEGDIDPTAALVADVIVLYRLAMSPPLERLIKEAHVLGKTVIFDTDDLIFEPELTKWHRGVARLSAREQELHQGGVESYLATLRSCDAVMAATPLLAEYAAKRGRRAYVHRNALGKEMMALAERLRESRRTDERIVIGYGSGTPTHDIDFQEVVPALRSVMSKFPETELWIIGPLEVSDLGDRVRRFPLRDWRGWFELLSQMDLALAPLEGDNVFCRAKSEIKFIEAAILGVPVVASKIDPFIDSMTEDRDGFLASSTSEWEMALTRLIEQPDLRKQIANQALATVLQRYSPEARARDLGKLLTQILVER